MRSPGSRAMADTAPPEPPALSPDEARALAGNDLRDALGWVAFGATVLVASIRMDRLEEQHINPHTVPGLLPGLLGIVVMLVALMLGVRSWRRGGRWHGGASAPGDGASTRRIWLVIGLCTVFGVVLVGHGLPFWLAAALYIAVSIVVLQRPQRLALGREVSLRDVAFALAVGLGSGWVITYVFQDLFLVRLP